jgi:hypothetical protein
MMALAMVRKKAQKHGGTWIYRNMESMSKQPDQNELKPTEETHLIYITIYKRSMTEWTGWVVWFLIMIFILQNAIASGQENEQRAALIFWILFGLLMIGGLIVYIVRKIELENRLNDPDE